MEPQYNPKETEDKTYALWEKSGFFNPDVCVKKGITKTEAPVFSIALPPPNVTGTLHLGHAFEHTLQDVMVRYHRMKGDRTLWVPGTDHAAIATQAKYEKELYKESKKGRHDFDRDDFFAQVHKFALKNQDKILSQMKKMGDSVDWSRLRFTLDKEREFAVHTAFKKMYDDGLIYRGFRIVNWDPKGQTTISDDEIVHEETDGMLYTFRYSKEFPISIATTRPETKVGDVAVAVHPYDARYKEYIGKTYNVGFVGVSLEITVIADEEIDPQYGTGAVGITPAHSMVDWEIAERHNLPKNKKVINEYARMEAASEELNGKKTLEAREIIIQKLRDAGLLEKEEKIKNNISKAERTGGIVEPLPKLQWFIAVNKKFNVEKSINIFPAGTKEATLRELMELAVKPGQIDIIPKHFEKIYDHWIKNLKDWCISRQILYGHRIPVWYHDTCQVQGKTTRKTPWNDAFEMEPIVFIEKPRKCSRCNESLTHEGQNINCTQDPDTLDTWFSSSLWTFSTLGWPAFAETATAGKPGQENDLANYHPTSVINPGYEILFLWVSRMIMMSGYLLGQIPFKRVEFHGIVRDKDGRKFSKSLNNGIDPLEVIEKYGADALRMSFVVGIAPGSDVKFDMNKVKAYQHFANKLWNAARFILMKSPAVDLESAVALTEDDKKILEEFEQQKKEITAHMESYDFYLAAEKLYHYFWHTFADKIIEESKPRLEAAGEDAASAGYVLRAILEGSLKMLHPFMPFVTEEIWQKLYDGKKMLIVEPW